MSVNFDYEGARAAGYSDDEINEFVESQPTYKPTNQKGKFFENIMNNASNFFGNLGNPTGRQAEQPSPMDAIDQRLLKKNKGFDVQGALESGYSPDEINEFLESQIPERSALEKGARVGAQLGLGMAEMEMLPYELAVAPLASKEAQQVPYRENLGEDIENLMIQKQSGDWSEQDEEFLQNLQGQMQDPSKSDEFINTADLSIRGLAEKATGLDLHPEGVLEKGANFMGFIKDPKKIAQVARLGLKPKQFLKEMIPGLDAARAGSVGLALEMAEEGKFGPIGTMTALVAGEVIGHTPAGISYVVKNPKQALAQATHLLTGANSKKAWTKQLIQDANELGIQLDAGTLTNSNLIKMAQARAVQSGLTGEALQEFQKTLSGQIIKSYEGIVGDLGELRFENNFQASEAIKEALKVSESKFEFAKTHEKSGKPREGRPLEGRVNVQERPDYQNQLLNRIAPQEFENSYQAGENLKTAANDIKRPIQEEFNQRFNAINEQVAQIPAGPQPQLANTLNNFLTQNEGSLLLGESAAEARVLAAARRLRDQLQVEGGLIGVSLSDLMKTKTTLGDVANFEFGGSNFESAYKHLVAEVDSAIMRTLQQHNPELAEVFQELKTEYSAFKDMFENKNVMPLFEPKNENYNAMIDSFIKNPDKLRSLEDIFYNNPRGQQLINQIKRDYAQRVISQPNVTNREIRDLANVLGPQFNEDVARFMHDREYDLAHPTPLARRGHPLDVQVQRPVTDATGRSLTGRAKESANTARKKMYNYLKDKSSDQIVKMMDSVENIRKLKKTLELTEEGKNLFKELSRYKIMNMIDKKMTNNLTEQVKLGTFSNLLKSSEEMAIAKELLGTEAFNQLIKLQKVSGRLAESAGKFMNASQSGTTVTDVAAISAMVTGVISGNPFMVGGTLGSLYAMRVASTLLADPVFLKHLEKAVIANDPIKLMAIFKDMKFSVEKATLEAKNSLDREKAN